jgi:DNA-binding NarL/FixJ family response regulator
MIQDLVMAVHILIIDADPSASTVTSAMVKRSIPHAIVHCETAADRAWLSIQQNTPDMLIIDPATQGYGSTLLIQLCKEELPATRIVVLASAPTPGLRSAMQSLGIDVYLEKPLALAKLTDKLRAVLPSYEDEPRLLVSPTISHS